MRKIRLIWDFRGPEAKHIAQHHRVHLDEYIELNDIEGASTEVTRISDMYTVAIMVVNEEDVARLRESLKPHRGQVHSG